MYEVMLGKVAKVNSNTFHMHTNTHTYTLRTRMQSVLPFQFLKDGFDGVGWGPLGQKTKTNSIHLQSTKRKCAAMKANGTTKNTIYRQATNSSTKLCNNQY